jgi:deazaflavin-dependent oxidoreductase (nitroreductase family)
VTISQRLGELVVAAFAIAFTRTPAVIRLLNPAMRLLLATPLPAGPNVLLIVRGRRSGRLRSSPVAFLDLGEAGYLQAASNDVDWVQNLRLAHEAVIRRGATVRRFQATEMAPEAAGQVLHGVLAPFPRSGLIRAAAGEDRPPAGVLHYFRLRVDNDPADYISVAERQPVFELRSNPRSGSVSPPLTRI